MLPELVIPAANLKIVLGAISDYIASNFRGTKSRDA